MMRIYFYVISLFFFISFTGCASNNNMAQIAHSKNSNESVEIYGKKIIFDEKLKSKYVNTFDVEYEFFPKNNYITVKNGNAGYFVNYDSKNRPEYFIELNKPMIIKNIKYTSDYSFAENPVDGIFKGVSAVIGTPFSLLNKTFDSKTPLSPSIAQLGVYQYNGKSYDGKVFDFTIEENNSIIVNNPFDSNSVKKIAITINKSWMPLAYTVSKTMRWNPGKIQIEAIDMSDFYGILDYTLKNRVNQEENEDIVLAVLQKDESLFKKLKDNKSEYNLPSVSFFNLPPDVNLAYAKNNKYKIFQEGIYKNNKGKYVKLNSDETVFDSASEVKIQVKTLEVDNKKTQYNKKDQKKQSKYVDFSEGI